MESNGFKVSNYLLAPLELRMANLLIDWIFLRIVVILIAIILDMAFFRNSLFTISGWIDSLNLMEGWLFTAMMIFVYYMLTEMFLARSFAKYITRTIVVMEDGSKPDYETITVRSLYRLIPFEMLTFLQNNSRGWHDSYSKTYVVKKARLDEKLRQFNAFQNELQNSEII